MRLNREEINEIINVEKIRKENGHRSFQFRPLRRRDQRPTKRKNKRIIGCARDVCGMSRKGERLSKNCCKTKRMKYKYVKGYEEQWKRKHSQ